MTEETETEALLPATLLDSSTLTTDQKSQIAAALFLDMPLDSLISLGEQNLVHLMCPEAQAAYVQRCNVLRSSAQTRKAALNSDATKLGAIKEKKSKTPKDNVSMAMALLAQLTKK